MQLEWKPETGDSEHAALVRAHLRDLFDSEAFRGGKRAQEFLNLIVEHALAGRCDNLRERMIGSEMFGRPVGYDTANDAVVRVKATEVRRKLANYYQALRSPPPVQIHLPPGSYVPQFYFSVLPSAKLLPTPTNGSFDLEPDPQLQRVVPPGSGDRISRTTLWIVTLVVAGCAMLTTAVFFAVQHGGHPQAGRKIRSIAILPLMNLSGNPGQDYFADGMTEELITEMGQISSLRVISRTSTMTYKRTTKTLPEIARELKVDGIIEGSIEREGNQVRITTQLIDASTDQHIWAHTYDRNISSVIELQSEVASAIADQIQLELTPQEHTLLTRSRSVSPQAEDLYWRGMELLNSETDWDPKSARTYFDKAIQADPNYAPPHAALADAIGRLGNSGLLSPSEVFATQYAEALKAIAIDGSLPQGHIQLGYAVMMHDWDWATEGREFLHAIQLNPNLSGSHLDYANYLERVGRTPEAIAETERALQLDPVSSHAYLVAGYHYYFARQYDQALTEIRHAVVLGAGNEVLYPLAALHTEKGMYDQAIEEFRKLDKTHNATGHLPYVYGHMGNAYARMGRRADARAVIAWLQEYVKKNNVGGYEIALVYAGLKNKDKAFEWMEKAYRVRDKGMTFLKVDPCVDPLRSDPRFQSLLQRVGFPAK